MKKSFISLYIIIFFLIPVFSQENESFPETAEEETAVYEADSNDSADFGGDYSDSDFDDFDNIDDDDIDDFDDFDSIFDNAEDLDEPVVDEEKKPETPIEAFACAFSSIVHFSGSFSGQVGAVYINNEQKPKDEAFTGYVTLSNTLNMSVVPLPIFRINGSVYTGIDNGFNIGVSSLYFNYLLLDHGYRSAGKMGISLGNLRLFNSSYYGCETHSGGLYSTGPKHVDIFSEDGALIALDVKIPWSFGSFTFAATGSTVSSIKPKDYNYYWSGEITVFNTNINLYVKRPVQNTEPSKKETYGLEVKRTILGFDTYAQGICRINDYKSLNHSYGYEYIVATAGIYRLWDSFDPNIGFNIEYQHEYDSDNTVDQSLYLHPKKKHYNRIAFEGGLKRLGSKKNIKVGVISHYTITDKHGFSGLNCVVSNILPYAEWSTQFAIGYGKKYTNTIFMLGTSLTLSLDY